MDTPPSKVANPFSSGGKLQSTLNNIFVATSPEQSLISGLVEISVGVDPIRPRGSFGR